MSAVARRASDNRRPFAVRSALPAAAAGLLLALAGCQQGEEIRHYRESSIRR